MKIKKNIGGSYILWIFLAIGLLLMCSGICCAIYFGVESRNYVEIEATITDIKISYDSDGDEHHYVTVEFDYNGVEYNDVAINFWDSGMYEGKIITILCHKDNPTKLQSKTIWILLPCILFGVGALFTLVISFPIHETLKKRAGAKYARKHGEVLLCKVVSVEPDLSYRVNGRIVNNILECEPLNESSAKYVSNPFSKNYSVIIGSMVKLYRDKENHANYYVDLTSLTPPKSSEIE